MVDHVSAEQEHLSATGRRNVHLRLMTVANGSTGVRLRAASRLHRRKPLQLCPGESLTIGMPAHQLYLETQGAFQRRTRRLIRQQQQIPEPPLLASTLNELLPRFQEASRRTWPLPVLHVDI